MAFPTNLDSGLRAPKPGEYDLISMDHPWAQKLAARVGEHGARLVIEFMREEGICFQVPAAFKDIVLNRAPLMVLKFLDAEGHPIIESEQNGEGWEPARLFNWLLSINGEVQLGLRSLEIPKLTYEDSGTLMVGLTYNCFVKPQEADDRPQ